MPKIKSAVRRTLARFDVGVYRISAMAPAAETFDVDFLPDVDVVIDVGVAHGTAWLYDRFPEADLLLVDPLPAPGLETCLGDRPHTLVPCALGSTPGTAEMTVDLVHTGRSSLLERTALTDSGGPTQVRKVEVRTLDQVVADAGMADGRTVGLKIDSEGFELEVLRGGVETLKRCAFVVCESSVLKRFEGSYRLEELIGFMADQGFGVEAVLAADPDQDGRIRFLDLAFVPRTLATGRS
jgi:FkbM family methyltransferase